MTYIKFSECLISLLSILDISANRLSKAINVDSSLVNRWVNGKRVPGYSSLHIQSIAEYFAKNILNSLQVQRLNELFLRVCGNHEFTGDQKEKITKILLEAQGFSIECKRKEQKQSKQSNSQQLYCQNINELTPSVVLSSADKIIFTTEDIFSAAVSLLEIAARQKCGINNTIYITYNSDLDIVNRDLIRCLRNALLKVINNGWNVILLLRLNNNTNRMIRLINFAKPLIKTGRFNPYYINKYDTSASSKENLTIPGIGVLSCFSTKSNSEINCAFYLRNKFAVKVFTDYYQIVLADYAQPLTKYYSPENSIDFGYGLIKSEENIGDRFLYKYCAGLLTLPENLYIKLLKKKEFSNDEMLTALDFYRKRLDSFLANIQNYQYYDIYSADSIKDLIKNRQLHIYSSSGIELSDLEVQDVLALLRNVITLLKTYHNYHIAFITRNIDTESTVDSGYYCVVKERQAVFVEIPKLSNVKPAVRLSIVEPMLVKTFGEYFKEIWEQIAPVNKNKQEIIEWLQSQINLLEKTAGI